MREIISTTKAALSNETSLIHIPLSEPCFDGNEWTYLKACLDTGWVSSEGPFVERFEREFAAYLDAKHAVATMNGTAALHLALVALGVDPGSEVLVPSLTFVASVNPILYCGAFPVFMDSDPHTLDIDPEKLRDFLRRETVTKQGELYNRQSGRPIRAIIVVHLYGNPADMDSLLELAEQYGLPIIEDATESLGACYREKKAGTLGTIGCFSFNGNKLITTGGGGMLVTANEKMAQTARFLCCQAKETREGAYHHPVVGFNYRLSNLQAALGVAQLEKIEAYLQVKKKHARLYEQLFADMPGIVPVADTANAENVYWLYTILVDADAAGVRKEELIAHLNHHGIGARSIFHPMHLMPPYRAFQAYRVEWAPRLFAMGLNIPNSVQLRDEEIRRVALCIRQACRKNSEAGLANQNRSNLCRLAHASPTSP